MSVDVKKQEKLREFVSREVLTNQSMLVSELLTREIISWGDASNLQHTDKELLDLGYEQETIDNDEAERNKEIYEWWVVTDWLAGKLEQHDEPILRSDFETWWGRCCTGQAILLDSVIEKIYDSLQR